jgi:hypothetical protein
MTKQPSSTTGRILGFAMLSAALSFAVLLVGCSTRSPRGSDVPETVPASAFQPNSWGFVGCSNTHDTIWGYHNAQGVANLFWPFVTEYHIEGETVVKWAEPNDRIWTVFDRMKQEYDHGLDPPVVWVQLCENLARGSSNYGRGSYENVTSMLRNLKSHSPTSIVYISPLQDYQPTTLCSLMGPGGEALSQLKQWANQAVADGLARPGPGAGGNPNLGPLTVATTVADHCHPSGGPHGPGPGAVFLGGQLGAFFDNLPRS